MKATAPRHILIILFGGSGSRFESRLPKQFAIIGGKPLMVYAMQGYCSCPEIDDIYVVAKRDYHILMQDIFRQWNIDKVRAIVPGGATRRESALSALEYLKQEGVKKDDLVMIADGDRPNVFHDIVSASFEAAAIYGAAVTAIPSADSVIYSPLGYEANEYLPRKMVYLAQTPQTFTFHNIYRAHKKAENDKRLQGYTDDASLVCTLGIKPRIIEGHVRNIKITTKADAQAFLAWKEGNDQ